MAFDYNRFTEAKTFTVEVGGQTYRLRRFNALMALRVYGSKAIGLVVAEGHPVREMTDAETMSAMRDLLAEAMVEPRLADSGDRTDAKRGVVSFEDLGGDAFELVSAVRRSGGGGEAADFPESSPAPTGSSARST
jgi:hypothetical protein